MTVSATIVIRGRGVVGGRAEGEALVTREAIPGWGGVNPQQGIITETHHELRGKSFKDKVLVFRGAKGSSGWSAMYHTARLAGAAPRALVFNEMTTKVALGAVVMRVPSVTDLDRDPLDLIETGDWVMVDGDLGIVEIQKSGK
jgi:predicted aconitase with swiveling domain